MPPSTPFTGWPIRRRIATPSSSPGPLPSTCSLLAHTWLNRPSLPPPPKDSGSGICRARWGPVVSLAFPRLRRSRPRERCRRARSAGQARSRQVGRVVLHDLAGDLVDVHAVVARVLAQPGERLLHADVVAGGEDALGLLDHEPGVEGGVQLRDL